MLQKGPKCGNRLKICFIIQVVCNAVGMVGKVFLENNYECVRFNVIIVTRGWVGVSFLEMKCYITIEWFRKANLILTI